MSFTMDAAGYLVFSGIEYLAMIVLIFSFFRMKPQNYIKEIALMTVALDILSFILVKFTMEISYFITPSVITIVSTLLFMKILKDRFIVSFLKVNAGMIIYSSFQVLISTLFVYFGEKEMNVLLAYDSSVYILQLISAISVLLVSLALVKFNRGYSFSLRDSLIKIFSLIFSIVVPVLLWICIFRVGSFSESNFSLMIYFTLFLLLMVTIIIEFSKYQEHDEFK